MLREEMGGSNEETLEAATFDAGHNECIELLVEDSEQHLDLSTPEMTQRFAEAPVYLKKAIIEAKQATEREEVKTILSDGEKETINIAEVGDYIATNPDGERYVIKSDTFAKRYYALPDGRYRAKGACRAFPNPAGQDIAIDAPWGDKQQGEADCMLAVVINKHDPDVLGYDRYIIGREEFEETYVLEAETDDDAEEGASPNLGTTMRQRSIAAAARRRDMRSSHKALSGGTTSDSPESLRNELK